MLARPPPPGTDRDNLARRCVICRNLAATFRFPSPSAAPPLTGTGDQLSPPRQPARLLIVRRENPLCMGETKDGCYFGSLSDALHGRVRTLRDYEASVIGLEDGRLWQEVQPILI